MANNTNKMFKVNDFVTVTGNTSFHGFNTGAKLKVLSNTGGSDIVLVTDGNKNQWLYNRDLKVFSTLQSTTKNDVESKVYQTALELIHKNGATTTLQIKLALRKKFSKIMWNQADVSTAMDSLASKNKFSFNSTGMYRTYNLPVLNKTVAKVVKNTATKKISRTKAVELMENSNGKFITVTFTKADGTVRTITCQYLKNTPPSKLGYIQVKDLAKMRAGEKKAFAQIDPRTVSALTTNGCSYDVK